MSLVGLIVNPIAGMGGRVGLKGTDGVVDQARRLGATPVAAGRAARALARLGRCHELRMLAAPDEMGADLAVSQGLDTVALASGRADAATSAADTRAAAAELVRRGVDLILFAGGDGTARDIHGIVGDRVPVLGIPTGVKMHSAVFATSPEHAGDVAASFVSAGTGAAVREAEIVDVDEEAARAGHVDTRLYGAVLVPLDRLRMQAAKTRSATSDEAAVEAVCRAIARSMDPRRIHVLGPGTTTRRIAAHLGVPKTLLGVDAVRGGHLIGSDLGESDLLELLGDEPATLIVGVVGGQGALFGRGNQQLSPAVLRRIGIGNIEVVAGMHKLLALDPPWLRVDTGDQALDSELAGYRRIQIAPNRTLVYKVAA